MPLQKSPQDVTREKKEDLLIQGTGRLGSDTTTLLGGALYRWNRPAVNLTSRIAGLVRNSFPPNQSILSRLDATSWTALIPLNQTSSWGSIACSDNGQTILLTSLNVPYLSYDGGTTWVIKSLAPATSGAYSTSVSSNGQVQIAAGNSFVTTSTDAGQTWTVQINNLSTIASGCCVSKDGTSFFVCLNNSTINQVYSKIGGGNWTATTLTGSIISGNQITCSDTGTQAMLTTSGGLYVYDGTSWSRDSRFTFGIRGCAMSSNGQIRVFTDLAGTSVYVSTNGGTDWIQRSSPAVARMSITSDGSVLYAASTNFQSLFRSKDLGVTWTAITPEPGRNYTILPAITSDGKTVMTTSTTVPRRVFIGYSLLGKAVPYF